LEIGPWTRTRSPTRTRDQQRAARCAIGIRTRDQRGEGPKAAILAAVRPLGPVRSWVGLGVVRGVQLGPWAAGFGGR
jgi:hypothetical protein